MADTAAEAPSAEPITTLPSGEPLPSSAPPPPSPSTKKTPALSAAVAAAPSSADAFLAHLARCLQGRGSADTVLMFLSYATRFGGAALEAASRPVLRSSAQKLVAMAFQLPPTTTVVLSPTPTPPLAALALNLSGRLKALGGLLSEWRTMNRLWGLLGLYFAFKKLLAAKKASEKEETSTERIDTAVTITQLTSLALFYVGENLAYLSSKKVLGFSPATQGKLAALSVRSWALYVALEISKLLVQRGRKQRLGTASEDQAWAKEWRKNFTSNLAWAPLTVQWSVPNGPLPDVLVWLLGLYPATVDMVDLWRNTA